MLNPLAAVGLVARHAEPEAAVLGTAFAFRQSDAFLTAAHCVGHIAWEDLRVVSFASGRETFLRVRGLAHYPEADVVILRTEGQPDAVTPFWDFVANYAWGEEFVAFGYPEDIFGESRSITPRLFRGHFQRICEHRSHLGYRYRAAELSIGAPAGLSGGPLFRPGAPVMLTGLVTENLESTTILHSIEQVERSGVVSRERYQRVITYGVALLLDGVGPWLDQNIAKRQHAR